MASSPKRPSDRGAFEIEVEASGAGTRLDQYLAAQYPAVSRSRWVKAIDEGTVMVDGRTVGAAQKLKAGQKISYAGRAESDDASGPVEFKGEEPTILFEDKDILVINKPRGLTVHPGHGIGIAETVVGWALAHGKIDGVIEDFGAEDPDDPLAVQRPGVVHRLDRVTSGAMVLARNPSSQAHLAKQFELRTAGRLYWAVVAGSVRDVLRKRPPKVEEFLQKAPPPIALRGSGNADADEMYLSLATRLERDPKDRLRFRVSPGSTGRRAVTHVSEISRAEKYSLVECKLETGRTHQIRVHLSFLGHPILGDVLYGGAEQDRTWLHAHNLRLTHPRSGEEMEFEAPLPESDLKWVSDQGLKLGTRKDLWNALK